MSVSEHRVFNFWGDLWHPLFSANHVSNGDDLEKMEMKEKKSFIYYSLMTLMWAPFTLWALSVGSILVIGYIWGPETANEFGRGIKRFFGG